jgi:hypothetical protein
VSESCAQEVVRIIISRLASWAGAVPGAAWAGAQSVVLWAEVSVAGAEVSAAWVDIPPSLRHLCSSWMLMAQADKWALQEARSTSLQQDIRACYKCITCACPDCIHK